MIRKNNFTRCLYGRMSNSSKSSVLLGVVLMLSSLTTLWAQEAIPASGGSASGSGGSASYSVGQVVYTTNTGTTASVAQGVQQAYTITIETLIDRAKNISLKCTAYPNPTTDKLILKIDDDLDAQLIVSLYDINGRILMTKNTDGIETLIPMEAYLAGTYLLKVTQINNALSTDIKTFKIIKK